MTRVAPRKKVVIAGADGLSDGAFPDITIPTIRIATFYTGAGPKDIEESS